MEDKKALFKTISIIILAIFVILVIFVLYIIVTYNNLITLDQDIKGKWSEVENQYQRQSELIPNIISAISSSVKVEIKFVVDVTDSRTKWQNAKTILEKDTAGVQMTNGITALVNAIATSENYPQLHSNQQYTMLIDELAGTQNRITTARTRYIESVKNYNIATRRFPAVLFARLFGFKDKEYYTADANAMQVLKIGNGTLP